MSTFTDLAVGREDSKPGDNRKNGCNHRSRSGQLTAVHEFLILENIKVRNRLPVGTDQQLHARAAEPVSHPAAFADTLLMASSLILFPNKW